jgi:hypothetical protein
MPILSSEARGAPVARYERLYIPLGVLVTTWEFLRASGHERREQLCFLAGRAVVSAAGTAAQATCCVLPMTAATGAYVTLTSHAQTALILDALENRDEVPLLSLHTHPDGGVDGCGLRHSEIDDRGVDLAPGNGVFSAVIGHYALGSPLLFPRRSAVYERTDGTWRLLPPAERDARVIVHSEMVRVVRVGDRTIRAAEA